MGKPVIVAAQLSKKFILHHEAPQRYQSLRDVIAQRVGSLWRPKDKDLTREEFYALKDLNFSINEGERVGIIGRNGAGKSTLLKILSRITEPSQGNIRIRGRVASLLEVGTGFHPELTGRENIYLNGAILGMSRREIKSKFDEIVDFAEVERFLDTPVKRYSSGMYVRLAFAVAAHLEPEILIVDEVLAVGDAQFQQKCLGKMQDVSAREGRTVLFVSHNLPSIKALCNKIIYLKQGQIMKIGGVEETISLYMSEQKLQGNDGEIPADFPRVGNGEARFTQVNIQNTEGLHVEEVAYNSTFRIVTELWCETPLKDTVVNIYIDNKFGERIVFLSETEQNRYVVRNFEKGKYKITTEVNAKLLPGSYDITLAIAYRHDGTTIDYVEKVSSLVISRVGVKKDEDYPWDTVHGYIEGNSQWEYTQPQNQSIHG